MTKKLKSGAGIGLGSSSNCEKSEITSICPEFSNPDLVEDGLCPTCGNCTLCEVGKDRQCNPFKRCKICTEKTCNTLNQESLDIGTCSCVDCKTLNPECLSCTVDTCLQCPYGKYPDGKRCLDCSEPCLDCTDKNTCTECKEGYYLNQGKCLKCEEHCAVCTDATTCEKCKAGYYMDNGTCTPCPAGTSSEVGSIGIESCTKCPKNTYAPTQGSLCLPCGNKCSNEGSTTCQTCVNNCNVYNQTGCAQCNDGYYSQTTSCQKCGVAHCKTCSSNNTCSACDAGYHIDNTYPNFCWPNITTRNAGDAGGPAIPSGVQWCDVGQPCNTGNGSIATCWRGKTANTCTSINGYSACERVVCNWSAAKIICPYNIKNGQEMYLPSLEHRRSLDQAILMSIRGFESYGFCSSYELLSYAVCKDNGKCDEASMDDGDCLPNEIWQESYRENSVFWWEILMNGRFAESANSEWQACREAPKSVRCAWD